jgi:spore coat protein U-like protein
MNRTVTAILATATLLVAAGSAWAGTASARISVSVNVISTCMASSTVGSPLSVRCSKASPVTVTVNADTVAGGLLAARLMNSAYGLPTVYTPSARLTAWADRSGNVSSSPTALTAMTAGEGTYGQTFGDASPGPNGAQPSGIVTVTVSY